MIDSIDVIRCAAFLGGIVFLWLFTGWLKTRRGYGEGDIRKVNHIAALAGGALVFGWLPEASARASVYAMCAALLMFVVVVCLLRERKGCSLAFRANTRSSDAPHEAFYFWSSWLVSVAGLLACDLIFQQIAILRTAALVVGIADGLAEPIGRRFGYHRYRILDLRGGVSFRSIEGSMTVLVCTTLMVAACSSPGVAGAVGLLLASLLVGIAIAVVEAASPRGFDNFTIPVASAFMTAECSAVGWIL